jgi:hypothetical protein
LEEWAHTEASNDALTKKVRPVLEHAIENGVTYFQKIGLNAMASAETGNSNATSV